MIIVQLDTDQLKTLIQTSVRQVLSESSFQDLESIGDSKNKLLSVQEAADFLNLSVATIYGKVSKREIPVMKKSKRLYFSKIELLDYIKSGNLKRSGRK